MGFFFIANNVEPPLTTALRNRVVFPPMQRKGLITLLQLVVMRPNLSLNADAPHAGCARQRAAG